MPSKILQLSGSKFQDLFQAIKRILVAILISN